MRKTLEAWLVKHGIEWELKFFEVGYEPSPLVGISRVRIREKDIELSIEERVHTEPFDKIIGI